MSKEFYKTIDAALWLVLKASEHLEGAPLNEKQEQADRVLDRAQDLFDEVRRLILPYEGD